MIIINAVLYSRVQHNWKKSCVEALYLSGRHVFLSANRSIYIFEMYGLYLSETYYCFCEIWLNEGLWWLKESFNHLAAFIRSGCSFLRARLLVHKFVAGTSQCLWSTIRSLIWWILLFQITQLFQHSLIEKRFTINFINFYSCDISTHSTKILIFRI